MAALLLHTPWELLLPGSRGCCHLLQAGVAQGRGAGPGDKAGRGAGGKVKQAGTDRDNQGMEQEER